MSTAPDHPTRVIEYHDATKHHPGHYARSLGYLDWETQPDPFRRYAGAPLLHLPLPQADDTSPYAHLFESGHAPPQPLTFASVSQFFYLSLAISAWKQAGTSRWPLRCNPSSGNLHPTEGYALLPAIAGLSEQAAVYHYAPRVHALERRAIVAPAAWQALLEPFGSTVFFVGLSSILWREAWKYGERAYRYCQHDVGHALGALWFAAAALDWRLEVLGALGDEDVAALLGLDRPSDLAWSQDSATSGWRPQSFCPPADPAAAEPEEPDLLAVVDVGAWPRTRGRDDAQADLLREFDLRVRAPLARAAWSGVANRLSSAHVCWNLIDSVAEAARRTRAAHQRADLADHVTAQPVPRQSIKSAEPVGGPGPPPTAMRIIRQRRSAVDFDGQTTLAAATFCRMLSRTLCPRRSPGNGTVAGETQARSPFEALPSTAHIHLLLFVHRVDGLTPGIYALVRRADAYKRLRAALHASYFWARPEAAPQELPLYLLQAADCRAAARRLSLDQSIAGDSAFSLGMLADLATADLDARPWLYRELFWEAGCLGQVLYLEAEAASVRATGIGAYFDDWVHETIGLRNHDFQSLYHFTVGGPLDDPRISTLPAYDPAHAR